MKSTFLAAAAGIVLATGASLGTMTAASAATGGPHSQLQPLDCTELGHITVETHDNNSSDHGGWGAAPIVDGATGTLVPTSLEIHLYDVTADQSLGDHAVQKGHGTANHNQHSVTCTEVQDGTLVDFLEPGEQPPPGTTLDDHVIGSLIVTAIHQP